jgi:hypothetical protein
MTAPLASGSPEMFVWSNFEFSVYLTCDCNVLVRLGIFASSVIIFVSVYCLCAFDEHFPKVFPSSYASLHQGTFWTSRLFWAEKIVGNWIKCSMIAADNLNWIIRGFVTHPRIIVSVPMNSLRGTDERMGLFFGRGVTGNTEGFRRFRHKLRDLMDISPQFLRGLRLHPRLNKPASSTTTSSSEIYNTACSVMVKTA